MTFENHASKLLVIAHTRFRVCAACVCFRCLHPPACYHADMWSVPDGLGRWTRRGLLLSGLASRAFAEERPALATLPSAWKRYTDPSTEFPVLRLTDPRHSSWLPPYYTRAIARHSSFLIYATDAAGSPQPYRMDLHTGESRQLTDAAHFDPTAFALVPGERGICYFDGPELQTTQLSNARPREVYRVPDGWARCPGLSVSGDGAFALFGEQQGNSSRLRTIGLHRGAARTILEAPWILSHPQPRPKRAQILYRQADEALWLVDSDGTRNRKLPLAVGRIGPARWSPDGRTVLYLHFPADPAQLHAIRECTPDQNADRLVAPTSQYAHFGCNANTSVFVGASRNRAAPYILLLLRLTRRELALCEHGASDAAMVAPIFSPDSQQIYFVSDRDGKPALYRVHVEQLVEKTDESG